ncbi:MAG: hypothetical protein KTR31_12905 [Myxococcales bacterium]|nr:hypothetical protein [Myxococcales bacterium]
MLRPTSILAPLLLTACAGDPSLSTTEPHDWSTPTAPTTPTTPDLTTPTVPGGVVTLQLVDEGVPVEGATVRAHGATGAELGAHTTDGEGRVVVTEVPPEGIGLTFPDLGSPYGGVVTLMGVEPGEQLVVGSAAWAEVEVHFTLPYGYIDAVEFDVRAGCAATSASELGEQGVVMVPEPCVPTDAMDVSVTALDASGEEVATAVVKNLEVYELDGVLRVDANLGGAGWRVVREDVIVVVEGMEEPVELGVHLLAPSSFSPLFADATYVEVDSPSVGVPFSIPTELLGPGEVFVQRYGPASGSSLRQHVNTAEDAIVRLDLGVDLPEPLEPLRIDQATSTVTLAEQEPFRCAGESDVDATLFMLWGTLDGQQVSWRILVPGRAPATFHLPELLDEVQSYGTAGMLAHSGLTYHDFLRSLDPFDAALEPALDDGETSCMVWAEPTMSCGPGRR